MFKIEFSDQNDYKSTSLFFKERLQNRVGRNGISECNFTATIEDISIAVEKIDNREFSDGAFELVTVGMQSALRLAKIFSSPRPKIVLIEEEVYQYDESALELIHTLCASQKHILLMSHFKDSRDVKLFLLGYGSRSFKRLKSEIVVYKGQALPKMDRLNKGNISVDGSKVVIDFTFYDESRVSLQFELEDLKWFIPLTQYSHVATEEVTMEYITKGMCSKWKISNGNYYAEMDTYPVCQNIFERLNFY